MPLEAPTDFGKLVLDETIRRNLRKTPDERYETLMQALRYARENGQWPVVDRKDKERRMLFSILPKLSGS